MSFFISDALAAPISAAGTQNAGFSSILMLVIFGVFIYFFLWRPQTQRAKQHRDMVSSLKEGDEVITSGGLVGKIAKIDEQFIRLLIAANSEVMIQRASISSILPKGTIKST